MGKVLLIRALEKKSNRNAEREGPKIAAAAEPAKRWKRRGKKGARDFTRVMNES